MEQESNIALTIKNLANQFHRYMTSMKANLGADMEEVEQVTDIQGRIINYLYERENQDVVYQKDIEKHFSIRRSTATNILNRIERNGYILRKQCNNDARMKTVTLTEKAKKLYPKAREEILKAERQAAKGLTEAELATFFRIVDVMGKNIS